MHYKKEKLYIKDVPSFIACVHNKEDLEKGYTTGSQKNIDVKCLDCGDVHNIRIANFSAGQRPRCKCGNGKRIIKLRIGSKLIKDISEFVACVHNKEDLKKGYTTGSNVKIDVKCHDCGDVHKIRIANFSAGQRCKCKIRSGNVKGIRYKSKFIKDIKSFVDAVHNKEDLEKGYTSGSGIKIHFDCPICGDVYLKSIHSFKKGSRCNSPKHYVNSKKQIIINESNHAYSDPELFKWALYPEELKYIKKNSCKTIKFKCTKCEYVFSARVWDFTFRNCRCPKCNVSKSEKYISNLFNMRNVNYKEQYRIKECRNKRPLPFDHALFKENTLVGLIEFHGIQHEKPIKRFGGEEEFKQRKQNDAIKEQYCKDNNIPLLIIWYYENIEEKLNEFLNTLGINN